MKTSIVRAVSDVFVRSIASVAAAIVLVSALTTTAVVVRRDDQQARAQALSLGAELRNHRDASLEVLGERVHHEQLEHSAFGRTIEVWRDDALIGPGTGHLRPWDHTAGCTLASVDGSLARVCSVAEERATTIVVASPVRPLLEAQLPMVAAVAFSAVCAAVVFSVVARRLAARSLAPLNAFDAAVASLPGLSAGRRLSPDWSAAEVDQLAVTFNALMERIDVAVAREQRFVGNAAHELRTPITRLRGQLELLQQDLSLTGEARHRLERAVRSCIDLGRSLESILALARPELLTLETVDLGELLTEVVKQLPETDRHRVTTHAEPAVVRGEELLLGFALRNLLDNALRYSPGAVEVSTQGGEVGCLITVRDHGNGIPEGELPRIREPFVRGKQHSRQIRGSGLGLALVDHVALQHGGALELQNGPSGQSGLVASLRLPPWRPASEGGLSPG